MSSKIINQGQSIFDKAIEMTGSVENAFELAILNGLSITEDLVKGDELMQISVSNKEVVSFFEDTKSSNGLKVESEEMINDDNFVIGSMMIKNTFIVR